jgi:hypothetical protein
MPSAPSVGLIYIFQSFTGNGSVSIQVKNSWGDVKAVQLLAEQMEVCFPSDMKNSIFLGEQSIMFMYII